MTSFPLAGVGQAAEADKDAHNTAVAINSRGFRICRERYFMEMGPSGNGVFLALDQSSAISKPSGRSQKIGAAARARRRKWPKMSMAIPKESRCRTTAFTQEARLFAGFISWSGGFPVPSQQQTTDRSRPRARYPPRAQYCRHIDGSRPQDGGASAYPRPEKVRSPLSA